MVLKFIACAVLAVGLNAFADEGAEKGKHDMKGCLKTHGITEAQEKIVHECHKTAHAASGQEQHGHGLDNPAMQGCLTKQGLAAADMEKIKAAFKACHEEHKKG